MNTGVPLEEATSWMVYLGAMGQFSFPASLASHFKRLESFGAFCLDVRTF